MSLMISHLIAFVLGTLTGVAGTYYGNKYTDRRRKSESAKEAIAQFRRSREQMPKLIAEMKADLEGNQTVREVFVAPSRRIGINTGGKTRLVYYADEHEDLDGKIAILENNGYLIDLTSGNLPTYRMTEEFVDLVLNR